MGERKPNFLESLWDGMKKKIEEKKMDSKGQELMTPEQKISSKDREDYLKLKKEMGYDGEIDAGCNEIVPTPAGECKKIFFVAKENGHEIAGNYYVIFDGPLSLGSILLSKKHGPVLTVDGKPCESSLALMYVEKMDPLIRYLVISKFSDREAREQFRVKEERQRAQARLNILLSSQPPEQREQPRA